MNIDLLPSHNVSAFQFCHLLAFHTPVLVCERRKTMRKFSMVDRKKKLLKLHGLCGLLTCGTVVGEN